MAGHCTMGQQGCVPLGRHLVLHNITFLNHNKKVIFGSRSIRFIVRCNGKQIMCKEYTLITDGKFVDFSVVRYANNVILTLTFTIR